MDEIILIILILLLVWYVRKRDVEYFDTYYNHDYGVNDIYDSLGIELPVKTTSRLTKYNRIRNNLGYDVYDEMYGIQLFKFGQLYDKMSGINVYSQDVDVPPSIDFNGETIHLSQKQW